MSLSVIIPTIGRSTLWDTLMSIAPQLEEGDEIIVVGDGEQKSAEELVSSFNKQGTLGLEGELPRKPGPPQYVYFESPGPKEDWGATPRNYAIERARGTHLVFMDDDDVYLPDAFVSFRKAIAGISDRPHIFRMHHREGILWRDQVIKVGNVSTQMYLVPNLPGKVGRWATNYEGDTKFISQTLDLYPEGEKAVVWHEEIVASLVGHGWEGKKE